MSDRSSAIVSNLLHVPPLQHIIDAMESPLIFDDFQNDWILQDPDLMPTWDDFQTVHLYFTTNPQALAHMAAMDVAGFMLTFFQQPAPLRLVITAIAAYYVGDAMTEETALWFFKRARKAVILAAERPSASTAKAYYWIYIYSKMMRKDALGLPFLKMSVEMAKHLKLDIDPDDSPWLHDLNLTEIEIEERRRLYWVVKLMVDVEKSLSLEVDLPNLSIGYVKPMQSIPGTFGIVDTYQPFAEIRSLIVSIKEHHCLVPSSVQEIIFSSLSLHLGSRLASIRLSIPPQYSLEYATDLKQTSSMHNPITFLYMVWMNFDMYACVMMVNRTKLYLTGLSNFDPSLLNTSTRDMIELAIQETLYATKNMIHAVLLLFTFPADHRIGITSNMLLLYPIFEAAISAWFLSCRLREGWTKLVAIPVQELQDGVALLIMLGETLIERNDGPIIQVLKMMMEEMRNVDQESRQAIDTGVITDRHANAYH